MWKSSWFNISISINYNCTEYSIDNSNFESWRTFTDKKKLAQLSAVILVFSLITFYPGRRFGRKLQFSSEPFDFEVTTHNFPYNLLFFFAVIYGTHHAYRRAIVYTRITPLILSLSLFYWGFELLVTNDNMLFANTILLSGIFIFLFSIDVINKLESISDKTHFILSLSSTLSLFALSLGQLIYSYNYFRKQQAF